MRKERVDVKKLGINGEGIGYIDKKICFIDRALPDETVDIEITQTNKKFYKGKLLNVVKASQDRIEPICKEKMCQGCSMLHLAYDKQLFYKKGVLKDAFNKFSEEQVKMLPISHVVGCPVTCGYRKSVSLPVAYFKGQLHVGIYQRESHFLTLMDSCQMQDPLINETLVKIEKILNKHKVRDYNDKYKKGLRFLKLRNIDGALQLLLVTGIDGIKEDVTKEIAQIDEIQSIFYTINTTRYQDFDAQGYKKIYGSSTASFKCLNQQYVYSIKSDFPINPIMEEKKLELIKSFVKKDVNVISVNCGIGLLELALDNEIVAIDEKNYHIKDAKDNAKFLRKDNVNFICKNIDEAVISNCKKQHFHTMIVRSEGLSEAIKESILISKIENIIYVSSHPSALAKDLELLKKYYRIHSITPIDINPNGSKFDTVVYLTRK